MHWIEELPPDIIDMLVSEQHTSVFFQVFPRLKTDQRVNLLADTLFRHLYPRLSATISRPPSFDFIRNILVPVETSVPVIKEDVGFERIFIRKNTMWLFDRCFRTLKLKDGEVTRHFFGDFVPSLRYSWDNIECWCSDDYLLYIYFYNNRVNVSLAHNNMWTGGRVATPELNDQTVLKFVILNMQQLTDGTFYIIIVGVSRDSRRDHVFVATVLFPALDFYDDLRLFYHQATVLDVLPSYTVQLASDDSLAYVAASSSSHTMLYRITPSSDIMVAIQPWSMDLPLVEENRVLVVPKRILVVQDFLLAFTDQGTIVPIRLVDGRELPPIPYAHSNWKKLVATEHGFAYMQPLDEYRATHYILKTVRLLDTISFRHKLGFITINKEPWQTPTLTCAGEYYKCPRSMDELHWVTPPLAVTTGADSVRLEATWSDRSQSTWDWTPSDE